MNNILVVGTSHVGAIKKGFDCIQTPPSFKFQYLATGDSGFHNISISDNYLVYPEAWEVKMNERFGLQSYPSLDDFDKILYVDGPCRLQLDLYSRDRRIPHLSAALVREIVENINCPLFASLLDNVVPSKLIYLGSPLISSAAHKKCHLINVPLLDRDSTSDFCLADRIREECHHVNEDDEKPSILLPPLHLLERHQFNTLDSYIRGGLRIGGKSRAEISSASNGDMKHANVEYGKEIATHVLDCLMSD